jgi:hypothetical protein
MFMNVGCRTSTQILRVVTIAFNIFSLLAYTSSMMTLIEGIYNARVPCLHQT